MDGDVPVISISRLVITKLGGGPGGRNIMSFLPFPLAFQDN